MNLTGQGNWALTIWKVEFKVFPYPGILLESEAWVSVICYIMPYSKQMGVL